MISFWSDFSAKKRQSFEITFDLFLNLGSYIPTATLQILEMITNQVKALGESSFYVLNDGVTCKINNCHIKFARVI